MPVTRRDTLVDAIPTSGERQQVQVVRGLACILVVVMHTIGLRAVGGMRVADDSVWRDITDLLRHFQMPLFSFLSGFVYAYRPVAKGYLRGFLHKKAARLLLPMIIVATLYFLCESLVPNPDSPPPHISEVWKIYVLPYNHLWFLQAIFLIFVVVTILDWLKLLSRGIQLCLALAIAIALRLITPFDIDAFTVTGDVRIIDVFSLNGALMLLPFFLLGLAVNRFRTRLQAPTALWLASGVFIVTIGSHWLGVLGVAGQPVERGTMLATVIGLSGVLFLFRWVPYNRALEHLGNASFAIYAYHVFFVAASRVLLHRLGISVDLAICLVGVVCGITGPLIADYLIRPIPIGRRMLLGEG